MLFIRAVARPLGRRTIAEVSGMDLMLAIIGLVLVLGGLRCARSGVWAAALSICRGSECPRVAASSAGATDLDDGA